MGWFPNPTCASTAFFHMDASRNRNRAAAAQR